ncbi:hypothetical protein Sango_1995000 [Sesamum angolense]|uniref:Uncharacterized protein n=1 Tax=Sesamum angolense TaxID=2727404 RepID=A0AAE1WF80_9LAMI|nr:hypothetical protein Sango_1995000 [Sesamum angolense]
MAAENCDVCLFGAMDCLWFQQTILFSKHSLSLGPEIPNPPLPISESPRNCSQESQLPDQETSSVASVITTTNSQDEASCFFQESDHDKDSDHLSSLPVSAPKQSRNLGQHRSFSSAGRLQKSMSCKSLAELELEEVKGFMDLGFTFKKENLSQRLMNLVPGLQRIESCNKTSTDKDDSSWDGFGFTDDHIDNNVEEKKEVMMMMMMMRPYLSEAWLIKRPDSPLLNLRIPRVSTTENMKKHLKDWARTVASAIRQES